MCYAAFAISEMGMATELHRSFFTSWRNADHLRLEKWDSTYGGTMTMDSFVIGFVITLLSVGAVTAAWNWFRTARVLEEREIVERRAIRPRKR
jgi:hypothetical protein